MTDSDTNQSSDSNSEPLYQKGAVNWARLHFIPVWQLGGSYSLDTEEAIQHVAQRLGHPAKYMDQDGYEVEITAAAVDPKQDRLAWVVCRAKEVRESPVIGNYVDVHFHLRALVEGQLAINWEIYTYNPYFGCITGYIDWVGDHVVIIYREKHDTYAASAHIDGSVRYVEITHSWAVRGATIGYLRWGDDGKVHRLSLPDLQVLPPLNRDEAVSAGFLASDDN